MNEYYLVEFSFKAPPQNTISELLDDVELKLCVYIGSAEKRVRAHTSVFGRAIAIVGPFADTIGDGVNPVVLF
jgi:hypothetical protein